MDQRDDLSGGAAAAQEAADREEAAAGANGTTRGEHAAPGDPAGEGGQTAGPPSGATVGDAPLEPGAVVGSYTIQRVLRASADEIVYQAAAMGDVDDFSLSGASSCVALVSRPSGDFSGVRPLIALGLRHPRLLAPRDLFATGGREYLVLDAPFASEGGLAPTVAEGAHLDPRSALTAGAGLADALAYLHRSGVAHGHLTPDVLYIHDGRAFLGGVERATFVPSLTEETPEALELMARDANALARALAAVAGVPPEPGPDEGGLTSSLREIAAQGAADAYATPNDVAGACSIALQQPNELLSLLTVETPPRRLAVEVGSATSVGRIRSENQDACASFVMEVRDDVGDASPVALLLVADGMGGEARGELASRIAARIVTAELMRQFAVPSAAIPALTVTSEDAAEALEQPTERGITQALARAAALANHQVRELARQLNQATGTTLTALALCGPSAALAHVGDSRAYLLRGGVLHKLTEDHSVLARLQAIDHPLLSDPDVYVPRSMLYRSLGQEDESQPDMLELTLTGGDRLLLCSDGLWDEVDAGELETIFSTTADPSECARRLVALANASGGHDNSTAVVAFVRDVAEDDDPAGHGDEAAWGAAPISEGAE